MRYMETAVAAAASNGDDPYAYLPVELRPTVKSAFETLPAAGKLFDEGNVPSALVALRTAGQSVLAAQIDLYMPYKFSS